MPLFKFPEGYEADIDEYSAALMGGEPVVREGITEMVDPSQAGDGVGPGFASGPPDTRGMHPLEAAAAQTHWERSMGFQLQGGTASVPEGFVPVSRTGGVPEPPEQTAERQNLAERERGLVRDERDVQFEENELSRMYAQEQLLNAEERVRDKETQTGLINDGVRKDRVQLDEQMQKHRDLIDKGIDPWGAYSGTESGAEGRIMAGLTIMSTGMGGDARLGIDMIGRIIDREIDLQKYAIETAGDEAENAYGRLRDSLGDRDQAESALRALMLDAAKHQYQNLVLETADPRSVQQANQAILEIDKRLLEENDAYRERSLGKVTERFQQGRLATSGGLRQMSPSEHRKYLQSVAQTAGTDAATQAKYADIQSRQLEQQPGSQFNEIIESIPAAQKKRLQDMNGLAKQMEHLFELAGATYDPKTGKKVGEFDEDVAGIGPLDKRFTWFSDHGKRVKAALNRLTYSFARPDVGANFTGIEAEKVRAFTEATFEGQQMALLEDLGKAVAEGTSATMGVLSPRQREALQVQQKQLNPVIDPTARGWQVR